MAVRRRSIRRTADDLAAARQRGPRNAQQRAHAAEDGQQVAPLHAADSGASCSILDPMPPFLIVPGYTNSGAAHWQSLWEQQFADARRVQQRDWDHPDRDEWIAALDEAIRASTEPPLLIAHSLGCLTVVAWAAGHSQRVAGALLVAPPDVEAADALDVLRGFAPIPMLPLRFPSIVVASENDPYATLARSTIFAQAWGSQFVSAGQAGHINTAAGYGPWPAGELLLQQLFA